ncbi:MAG: 5'/3'-nucleotidase SurE [Chloroflexi bacterium RBG_19FT_COMBO_49_13]|nr:MAG: 5'/3'-nucleotidase SurE [Chloroflexi bacterium RBG_19FT_COMBO_49_13]
MHILVTNDDGIFAPGLLALVEEMRRLGKVSVLAPDHNWSASGHVKTMHRPLRVKETLLADGSSAWASDGAPSDCVALGLLGFFSEKIDLVVSGINPNANIGHDVTYSGTVTAAMEASIGGVAGMAFSLHAPEDFQGELDFLPAAKIAYRIVAAAAKNGNFLNLLLNVNIPYLPEEEVKGFLITRQGLRVYRDRLDRRLDPRGRPYYWIGGEAPTAIPDEGTDFGALEQGFVSITPLHLDLTDFPAMNTIREINW